MCIAVYKPAGQKVPSKQIFENCFDNNSDGAGYMFAIGGKVHYFKGFMTLSDFNKSLKKTIKQYGGKNKMEDIPMVFHFRITSQGGVKPELTHPFPVCDDYNKMKELSGSCNFAIAHNGIIDFASSYGVVDHNDTMEFIKYVAYPQIGGKAKYYQDKKVMDLLRYLLEGNRIAIMSGDGHVELIGNWLSQDGIFYSNATYSYKKTKYTYSSYYKSTPTSSTLLKDYDDDGYSSGYPWWEELGGNPKDNPPYKRLTSKQINDLYQNGELLCECGKKMVIDYDDYYGCYIAYCNNKKCFEEYMLDDDVAEFALSQQEYYEEADNYDADKDYYNKQAYGK